MQDFWTQTLQLVNYKSLDVVHNLKHLVGTWCKKSHIGVWDIAPCWLISASLQQTNSLLMSLLSGYHQNHHCPHWRPKVQLASVKRPRRSRRRAQLWENCVLIVISKNTLAIIKDCSLQVGEKTQQGRSRSSSRSTAGGGPSCLLWEIAVLLPGGLECSTRRTNWCQWKTKQQDPVVLCGRILS